MIKDKKWSHRRIPEGRPKLMEMAKTILIADTETGMVKILGTSLLANDYYVIAAYDGPQSASGWSSRYLSKS